MSEKIKVEIFDHRDEILDQLKDYADKVLEYWGIELEKQAKIELAKSPNRIDTGLLRNSITYALSGKPPHITSYKADKLTDYADAFLHFVSNNGGGGKKKTETIKTGFYSGSAPMGAPWKQYVYIGTNVEYAQWVHNGTRRMAPNRFILNAVNNNKDKLQSIAKDVLSGKL